MIRKAYKNLERIAAGQRRVASRGKYGTLQGIGS